jgi:hypothetical protein
VDLVEVHTAFDFVYIYGLFKKAVTRADDLSVCGELESLMRMNDMGVEINIY